SKKITVNARTKFTIMTDPNNIGTSCIGIPSLILSYILTYFELKRVYVMQLQGPSIYLPNFLILQISESESLLCPSEFARLRESLHGSSSPDVQLKFLHLLDSLLL